MNGKQLIGNKGGGGINLQLDLVWVEVELISI